MESKSNKSSSYNGVKINQSWSILNEHRNIKIDEKFVIKLTKENKSLNREAQESCKVFHFSSEWNFEEVLKTLRKLNPKEYPHLFIFIIEVKNCEFFNENSAEVEKLKEVLLKFSKSRPLLLQLSSEDENVTKLYYKEEYWTKFLPIDHQLINVKEIKNFSTFLCSFLDRNFDDLEGEVIDMLPQIQLSSLFLKFLRILYLSEDFFNAMIVNVSKKGTKTELLASLDAPFETDGRVLSSEAQNYLSIVYYEDSSESEMSTESDQSEENLSNDEEDSSSEASSTTSNSHLYPSVLLTAIENKNEEVIDYLITFWTHLIQQLPFNHQIRISTEAFKTNQLDVLCDLLNIADFPFPEDLEAEAINHKRLCETIAVRKSFEAAIKDENIEELDTFIDKSLNLRTVYNTKNKSALDQALEHRKFVAYFYLKSIGFQGKNAANLSEILTEEELEEAEQQASKQRAKNVKEALRDVNNSAMILSTRSLIHDRRTSKEKEAEYRTKIKKWFEDIIKIKYGPELLNAAASCERLKIIFDFERHKVDRIDLLSSAYGLAYNTVSSIIFIGAKLSDRKREQEIKGTLAHELCHYVMDLVYENHFLPYYEYEKEICDKFDEIVKSIDKWSADNSESPDDECNGIISLVFTEYNSSKFHLELIVRAVHILAEFDDDEEKSKYLQDKYKTLFDFWHSQVIPELKKFSLEDRKAVEKINKYIGLLPSIQRKKIKPTRSEEVTTLTENKFVMVLTNAPILLFIDIKNFLQEKFVYLLESLNLFVDPEKLNNRKIRNDIKQICEKGNDLNILIDCTSGFPAYLKTILYTNELHYIIVASNESQCEDLVEIFDAKGIKNATKMEISYKWSDLTEDSQKLLLKTKINFQNNSQFSLMELLNGDENEEQLSELFSELIDDRLLNLLVENLQVQINASENNQTEKRFDLLLQSRNFYKKYKSVLQIRHHPEREPDRSVSFFGRIFKFFKKERVRRTSSTSEPIQEEVKFFSEYELFSEMELISKVEDMQYVLISDKAGNGKSCELKKIAKVLREKNPTRWVTYVDLKQFIGKFKEQMLQKSEPEFSTFIADKILKLKHKFEAATFKRLYNVGKVSILFDGFDEIAPNCAEFVSKLAQSFEFKGGNQLWIATRDYFEVNLADRLQIETVYSLDDFSIEDGINLITRSWVLSDFSEEIKIDSENDFIKIIENSPNFENYQEKARQMIEKVAMSEYRSFGLPQLFKIISDRFKDYENIDNIKGLKIYLEFVKILYKRWSDEKGQLRKEASLESQQYDLNFWKFHQYSAIESLFPELVEELFPDYDGSEWSEEEIVACGLMTKKGDKFYFIHETFLEFFVADFIARAFNKKKMQGKIFDVFVAVLTEHNYDVIRMFLNDAISDFSFLEKNPAEMERFISSLEKFGDFFTDNLENLANFAIMILKHGNYKKTKSILNLNASNVVAFAKNPKMFWKFQEFLFEFLKVEDLKKLITKQRLLQKMIGSCLEIEIFEEFVGKVEGIAGREFIRQLLKQESKNNDKESIFHLLGLSLNFTNQKYQKCMQIIRKFLSNNEIFELTKACNDNKHNILHACVNRGKNENLKILWTEVEKIYKAQNLSQKFKDFVKQKCIRDQNILHMAGWCNKIEVHETLWELLLKLFQDREELFGFIMENKERGNNFFHNLAKLNINPAVFELAFKILKENFKEAQIQRILNSKGESEMNLLLSAVSNSKEVKIHQFLWTIFRNLCKTDEKFMEVLKEVDENGVSILNLAVESSSEEVFEFIMKELEKVATHDEIREMLSNLGEDDKNLLQSAVYNNFSTELHAALWETLRKYFNPSEILEFIKHVDCCGENLIFYAVCWNLKDIIEFTWNEIKTYMNKDEQVEYLKIVGGGKNLIEKSMENYRGKDKVRAYVQNLVKGYEIKF